jgi:DNA-binding response OmpR family regulator
VSARPRVLIAEDEPVSRCLLQRTLTSWGYDVVVAEDGAAAWDALRGPDSPTLAILDRRMPGLDGLELCRRVRARCPDRDVYIVLLTAGVGPEDAAEGLGSGADECLGKPFESRDLRARLRAAEQALASRRGGHPTS